jgi:hypothetical protein
LKTKEDLNLQLQSENDRLRRETARYKKDYEEMFNNEAGHKQQIHEYRRALKKQKKIMAELREENKFYSQKVNFKSAIATREGHSPDRKMSFALDAQSNAGSANPSANPLSRFR